MKNSYHVKFLTEASALIKLIIIIKHMKKTGPEIIPYSPSGVETLKILKPHYVTII
jgi:hypothetical protein